jgi:hypothetical protein
MQSSMLLMLVLVAGIVLVILLFWLLNKVLRRLGVGEYCVDHMGSSLLGRVSER